MLGGNVVFITLSKNNFRLILERGIKILNRF